MFFFLSLFLGYSPFFTNRITLSFCRKKFFIDYLKKNFFDHHFWSSNRYTVFFTITNKKVVATLIFFFAKEKFFFSSNFLPKIVFYNKGLNRRDRVKVIFYSCIKFFCAKNLLVGSWLLTDRRKECFYCYYLPIYLPTNCRTHNNLLLFLFCVAYSRSSFWCCSFPYSCVAPFMYYQKREIPMFKGKRKKELRLI